MPNAISPLLFLLTPAAKWVRVAMVICCALVVVQAAVTLKDDIRRTSRVRTRRSREEWVLEPEVEPEPLTPSELNRKSDSLKNDPGYKNRPRVEIDIYDIVYN
jgi:hypothetical protein